jgi:xanthine dehydrogenase accessory factor
MDDLNLAITRAVLEALEGGDPVATATVMVAPNATGGPSIGAKILIRPNGEGLGSLDGGAFDEAVRAHATEALRQHAGETIWLRPNSEPARRGDPDTYQVFIETFESPETLLIVGCGHIGLSLATIGEHVGFSVVVLDDRPDYANRERFPMADRVICGDFVEELERFPLTPSTYIVVVTRGHKQDEISVRTVVGRGARYVGMIGSKRRVGAVLQHLMDEGIAADALEAVHTPIGLDIRAETPAEIAVSIIAEIIAVRRGGGSGRPMAERRAALRSALAAASAD